VKKMIVRLVCVSLAALAVPLASWADCQMSELFELPVTMQGLRPVVSAKINGADARFVLDSGYYESWIGSVAASRLKLKATLAMSDYRIQSAGGSPMANVKTFTLGGVNFRDVPFDVDEVSTGKGVDGAIGQKLLMIGDVDYDLHDGVVRLMRPKDCGHQPLAYWLKPGETFGEVDLSSGGVFGTDSTATATINGVDLKVGFRTGLSVSLLTLQAAKKLGINLNDPGVAPAGAIDWEGERVKIWIAPIKSFAFAGEEIRDTSLRVTSADITGYDLMLGADYFASHRLYFANGQHKLYVTYAGGPVFAAYNGGANEGRKPEAAKRPEAPHTPPPVAN
jgi:predicted aspartyl protease